MASLRVAGEEPEGEMCLADFRRWKVDGLKNFLRKRGLKYAGKKKDELVSLAYGAHQMKAAPIISSEETMKEQARMYRSLLSTQEGILPDPFNDMPIGWLNEEKGITSWPPTMQLDISEFLLQHVKDQNLSKRLLSDYKEGKAYSYFASNFLGEVMYHPIGERSKFCFLKAKSTPSQSVTAVPHSIWVLLEKKSGKVAGAYCTCFAGLGSTCNHVAAVLFKVEHAWTRGWTNPSCTSRPCEWNQFGAKGASIEAKKVQNMDIKKPHYKKKGQGKSVNPPARQLFRPTQSRCITNQAPPTLTDIMNSMYGSCRNACIFEYVHVPGPPQYSVEADINVGKEVEAETSASVPLPLAQIAAQAESSKMFFDSLPVYSPSQVHALEECTRGQANSSTWKEHRVGMITASTIHNVWTKMNTLKSLTSLRSKDPSRLLKKLCSISADDNCNVAALKYGRQTEPEARDRYVQALKDQGHHNVSVKEAGLCILPDTIFIGASPDGLVSCSCCGEGLLEIKCPISIAHQHPKDANLGYLQGQEVQVLKKMHPYYSQMVTQMAVTQRHWCDFFVYTKQGYHMERIPQDKDRWEQLKEASLNFFQQYMAPMLVTKNSDSALAPALSTSYMTPGPSTCDLNPSPLRLTPPAQVVVTQSVAEKHSFSTLATDSLEMSINPFTVTTHRLRRQKKRKLEPRPVYVCGVCQRVCKYTEDVGGEEDNSVCCDKCNTWFHWGCVGYDDESDDWLCPDCEIGENHHSG